MSSPIAYLNGRFVSHDEVSVAPQDLGFMWGVTIAEQLRTIRGELFLLDQHLERLALGLQTVGVGVQIDDIAAAAQEIVRRNFALVDPSADLGVTIFVTPGISRTYRPDAEPVPTTGVHSYPLPFSLWAEKYRIGQHCELSHVQQVPAACWPRAIKARSRLHYFLADQEVRSRHPAAQAILLDDRGYVSEASTANVIAHLPGEGLVSPPLEDILPGVSLRFVESLAKAQGEALTYRKISSEELDAADEILLTSTPYCILPVSQLGKRALTKRERFNRLLKSWSEHVGIDIEAQALS